MGLEGFSGNESILYHLQSPCRVRELGDFEPIERDEWVPDAHAHRHLQDLRHRRRRRPDLRAAPADVERRRRDLARAPDRGDGFLLPQRRGRRGDLRPRGLGHARDDLRRRSRTSEGDYVVIPRGTTYRFASDGPQRHLVFESPGLIEIPRRYRNEYGQLLEHAPFYHRDIHPPTELQTHRDRGDHVVKVRVKDGYQTLRPRLPPVRRRRLGRLRLPVDVQHPRLRADHGPHPHAAAVAPDVRRARTS